MKAVIAVLPLLVMSGVLSAWQAAPGQAPLSAGKKAFLTNCSFCHGATGHGGAEGGPNLTTSNLVINDKNGERLKAFLQVGRPAKGMPAFHLAPGTVTAMAGFLHSMMRAAPSPEAQAARVLVGDAVAGRAFFEGEGHCTACHSARGDLRGIGAKYPPPILQGRLVLPIGDGGYPGYSPAETRRIPVTITQANGDTVAGSLVFLSDYAVTVLDSAGEHRTLPRRGDVPKIEIEDPLQAHLDRQSILTDIQMHDLTAYLATLK